MQFGQTQNINITGSVTVGTITGTVNVAGTVAISGGSVSISGTPNVNVTGGSITISSGTVSISAGTITSITNNVTVQSAAEAIYSTTWNDGTPLSQSLTLTQAVQGFKLHLSTSLATTQIIEVTLTNNTNLDGSVVVLELNSNYPQLGNNVGFVFIPFQIAGAIGDSISFSLTKLNATANGNVSVSLVGVGEAPAIRTSPGLPIQTNNLGGINSVSATLAGAGTVALLPVPQAGLAYRLQRITYGSIVAGTTIQVNTHTTVFRIAGLVPATFAYPGENLDGLLIADGIDLTIAGGGGMAYLFYDIVNYPTII